MPRLLDLIPDNVAGDCDEDYYIAPYLAGIPSPLGPLYAVELLCSVCGAPVPPDSQVVPCDDRAPDGTVEYRCPACGHKGRA